MLRIMTAALGAAFFASAAFAQSPAPAPKFDQETLTRYVRTLHDQRDQARSAEADAKADYAELQHTLQQREADWANYAKPLYAPPPAPPAPPAAAPETKPDADK